MYIGDQPTTRRQDQKKNERPPPMQLCLRAQRGLSFLHERSDVSCSAYDSEDDKAAQAARLCRLILGAN
jgi:hypothetical protein